MRRDRALIEIFLHKYNAVYKHTYQIVEVPDEVERNRPAVDAIAQDENDRSTLAIEHTLIQPFLGERFDAQPFSRILEPLRHDPSLLLPGYLIAVTLPVGAVPKGLNQKEVAAKVSDWFRNERDSLPDGISSPKIPGLEIDLMISVEKVPMGDEDPGCVVVGRSEMPETFEEVLRKAIREKTPKLLATPADKRVLLLENRSISLTVIQVEKTISSIKVEYPNLLEINQIWVADTVVWGGTSMNNFFQVSPKDGIRKLA